MKRLAKARKGSKEGINRSVRESIARTQEQAGRVPEKDSFIDLRGVLEGSTDDEGRSGTEMLQAARRYDKQKDEQAARQLCIDE